MGSGWFNTGDIITGGVGLGHNEYAAFVRNRTGSALALGGVAQMDFALSATETTDFRANASTGASANVVGVTANGAKYYPIVLAAEAIADDAVGKVWLRANGVKAAVTKADTGGADTDTNDNVAIGDPLFALASSVSLSADPVTDVKCVAIAQEAIADPGTDTATTGVINVAFDGLDGW